MVFLNHFSIDSNYGFLCSFLFLLALSLFSPNFIFLYVFFFVLPLILAAFLIYLVSISCIFIYKDKSLKVDWMLYAGTKMGGGHSKTCLLVMTNDLVELQLSLGSLTNAR